MIKKYLYIFLFCLFATTASADKVYWYNATSILGGTTSSLDSINGVNLVNNDKAFVVTNSGQSYIYNLDTDSGLTEDSTNYSVVSPDSNAGTKRWILMFKGDRTLIPDSTIDQGDNTITGTLAWHITNAAGNPTNVRVLPGTYKITTSTTVPITMNLDISKGGIFKPDVAKILTVYSPQNINALSTQQIVDATSNVTNPLLFTVGGVISPNWWGGFTSISLALAATSLDGIGGVIQCLSGAYTITTLTTIPRGVSLIGTHIPSQLSPTDVPTIEGTRFNRTADIGVIQILGDNLNTLRHGSTKISGIAFISDLDVSTADTIYIKWGNNIFIEKCTFFNEDAAVTVGHEINLYETWDTKILHCTFKGYGNTGGTKFAINISNGAVEWSNFLSISDNQFANGNGGAIYSDASGAYSTRNPFIEFVSNKFEDNTFATVQPFIGGSYSHIFIDRNFFVGNDEAHIVLGANCDDIGITNNSFSSIGDTPTEYIHLGTAQHARVVGNNFGDVGAAMTSYIKSTGSVASRKAGGSTDGLTIVNNSFWETVRFATPMFTWTDFLYFNAEIKNNNYNNETVTTGSPALLVFDGYTELNSNGGAITATLDDGIKIGDIKTIVMSEASTSSTVTVAKHDNVDGIPAYDGSVPSGDGEVGTFDALDETWILMWTGTEWTTLRATCTFL